MNEDVVAPISLLQLLFRSGMSLWVIVAILIAQGTAWLLTLVRTAMAFGATAGEARRAEERIAAGGTDAGLALADYHAATARATRWPHGFLALGGLAFAVALQAHLLGQMEVHAVIAQSPAAPDGRDLAMGHLETLAILWVGAALLAATVASYAGFGALLSLADFLGRRRVLAARAR